MSISSFNLSRSESRRNAGHDDHFHRTVPDFDNDWQALRAPDLRSTVYGLRSKSAQQSTAFALERSKIETNMEKSERASSDRRRSSGSKSHSHSVELDAINVIININNVIGHKKNHAQAMKRSILLSLYSAPSPSLSIFFHCVIV